MMAQGQFISAPGGGGAEVGSNGESQTQASKSRNSLADAGTDDVESQQDLKSLELGGNSLRRRKGDTAGGESPAEEEVEVEAQRHGTWKSCVGHIITAVM